MSIVYVYNGLHWIYWASYFFKTEPKLFAFYQQISEEHIWCITWINKDQLCFFAISLLLWQNMLCYYQEVYLLILSSCTVLNLLIQIWIESHMNRLFFISCLYECHQRLLKSLQVREMFIYRWLYLFFICLNIEIWPAGKRFSQPVYLFCRIYSVT